MDETKLVKNNPDYFFAFGLSVPRRIFSRVAILILLALLSFAIFKNISYPLIWNDEADTTMFAQQVIKYGYPKAHDEKNSIFIPDNPMWLGYKPSQDILTGGPWANYYFGAIGVKLAEFTQDIYQKTALIRLPFAIAGLMGLLLFAFSFRGFFDNMGAFRIFFSVFLVFEILSVNLLMHIREARYYSLVILITAWFFYIFSSFHFHHKYTRAKYLTLLTVALLAAFNISFLTYVSLFGTVGLYQSTAYLNNRWRLFSYVQPSSFKESLVLISPLFLSALLLVPQLRFFEFFQNAKLADLYYHNSFSAFVNHLHGLFSVLSKFDLLLAMIVVKLCKEGYSYLIRKSNLEVSNNTKILQAMEFFMLLFFVVLAVFAARMPWLFTRYFIVLQPVIILVLLTDVIIILAYESILPKRDLFNSIRVSFLPIACLIGISNIALSQNNIANYIYQLSHPLKGPLDFYIPAIKEKFPHTDKIVLATNYEEASYEYYLDCKIIVGYNNHFKQVDEKELRLYSPDVMIIRPFWKQSLMPYQYYLQHGNYQKVIFPVADRPVNDLPELNFFMVHQFKTNIAETDDKKAYMYLKVQP